MSDKVEIPVEKLNSLRRLFNEAEEIFQGLAAGGFVPKTPQLTAQQKRDMKFNRLLETGSRAKKPEHLKNKKPRK